MAVVERDGTAVEGPCVTVGTDEAEADADALSDGTCTIGKRSASPGTATVLDTLATAGCEDPAAPTVIRTGADDAIAGIVTDADIGADAVAPTGATIGAAADAGAGAGAGAGVGAVTGKEAEAGTGADADADAAGAAATGAGDVSVAGVDKEAGVDIGAGDVGGGEELPPGVGVGVGVGVDAIASAAASDAAAAAAGGVCGVGGDCGSGDGSKTSRVEEPDAPAGRRGVSSVSTFILIVPGSTRGGCCGQCTDATSPLVLVAAGVAGVPATGVAAVGVVLGIAAVGVPALAAFFVSSKSTNTRNKIDSAKNPDSDSNAVRT
jgi:hypothetical protein